MNLGHIIKAALVILAMACVSYVGFGFGAAKNAEAATTEQIEQCAVIFSTMKFRVISERKVRWWDAQVGSRTHCYTSSPPSKLSTPPKGQGWYGNQWGWGDTSTPLNEEQCYAQP